MRIKSLFAVAIISLSLAPQHVRCATSVGIELRPIEMRDVVAKDYLAPGILELLTTRLSQKGLAPYSLESRVNIETGYALGCSLASNGTKGLVLQATLWKKGGLGRGQEAPPLKTFTIEVPGEEGLFQAIDRLSTEVAQFVQLHQESVALRPIGPAEKAPTLARLPLENTPRPHPPLPQKGEEKTAHKASTPVPKDYIPDQVPDLPPDDEGPEETVSGDEGRSKGPLGIFSRFWPHRKDSASSPQRTTPYTSKLIVPTPEEITMEESHRTSKVLDMPGTRARDAQRPLAQTQALSGENTPSLQPPRVETRAAPQATPRETPKPPRWKWF